MNDMNDIDVDVQEEENKDIDNEDLTHIDITETELEANWDTLKNVIEEYPDDHDDKDKKNNDLSRTPGSRT